MIIGRNNGNDRHIPSWSHHQKSSFPTPGAMQSTLQRIAEQVKKLAFQGTPYTPSARPCISIRSGNTS